jgi:hypothetical protein
MKQAGIAKNPARKAGIVHNNAYLPVKGTGKPNVQRLRVSAIT